VLAILALRDVPFWKKSWLRQVLRFVVAIVYAHIMAIAILLPLENRLLFPGWSFGGEWFEPDPRLGKRDVELTTDDGTPIHAWFMAPKEWKPEQGVVLYSHGNGGNLSMRMGSMSLWRRELKRAVLGYDYPGYGKSGGKPTEARCYAAAEAAHAWLVEEQKVPAKEVILLGSSLGGAMATELATRHEHRLLVLCGSFTSFPDMAQKTLPWVPGVRWLVSNRMDNLDKIARVRAPVFIAHGTADQVVPYRMGERLFERAQEPKRFYRMDDHPHMHPSEPAFFAAVRAYLEETR
jgi:pimeloyl-ACP methyl ester carboxylesterase